MIRVLLVASAPALRAGLRALISSDNQIKIMGERNGWDDWLEEEMEADVVITTSASLSSISERSRAGRESPAVLLLSDEPLSLRDLRRNSQQPWGILPVDASAEELLAATHALAEGLIVGARSLMFAPDDETPAPGPLTDRESEVLALLAKGLANKQIAAALGISEHTAKFHVSSIFAKLNVANRTEAVREGLRSGWIAL